MISVATLTELIKLLGENIYKKKINELVSSNLEIIDLDQTIAISAGELRMRYGLFTADAQIAATGIIENVKHILTNDSHFDILKNRKILKKIDLKTALKMVR